MKIFSRGYFLNGTETEAKAKAKALFLSVQLDFLSTVLLSSPLPEMLSVNRGRMVSQAPKGRWVEREILETTDLQESVEKMDLRVLKARWVPKEKPARLALLERRYVAAVAQAYQKTRNVPTCNSNILH